MSLKQRVHLSLKKKVEVITTAENNRTLSLKALGELFGCGKTQIGKILKNKDGILASYPELLHGFRREDIWNIDETGCFWKALPDRGFGQKGKECKGGKKCKQRLTVASAAGETETPIVIGMSERPRCFKGVNKSHLPVKYFHQKKAWMSSEILDKVLSAFNPKMKAKDRSILLLMDNAGCHPEYLKEKYSHIKIVFLPPNTTSKLQPLDLGIIQNKVHYRHLLLRFVLAKIEECSTASDVVKSVNLFMAIHWVARAWNTVCFR